MTRLTEDPATLRELLETKAQQYHRAGFIGEDPIVLPHRFNAPADIEIAGFFAAILAWGNRTTIIKKGSELLARMDDAPHQFIVGHSEDERRKLLGFVHRTFQEMDLLYFVHWLQAHYRAHDSLEAAFRAEPGVGQPRVEAALNAFKVRFFSLPEAPLRTRKHIASPAEGSACKRLNMFLRWMVRSKAGGVDFGLWTSLQPSDLVCPLDTHVARTARRLGLITRPQNDWKAALELTETLREMDPNDPVRFDYALFGLGLEDRRTH